MNHRGNTVSEIKHRTVETNGIHMHIAESGAGPLVVLCHGFPELHGIPSAISCMCSQKLDSMRSRQDMRGYGQTDRLQNNSIGPCCSIMLATWSACSMR